MMTEGTVPKVGELTLRLVEKLMNRQVILDLAAPCRTLLRA